MQKAEDLEVQRYYLCELLNGDEDTNHSELSRYQQVKPFVPQISRGEIKVI